MTGTYSGSIAEYSFKSLSDAVEYAATYASEHTYEGSTAVHGDYCRSSDLKEIYEFSSNVIEAEITGIVDDSIPDRTSYSFKVIEEIKGTARDEQWVAAFKDSMKTGERYVLLLTKPGETSAFFVVDSLHSVIPENTPEAETVKEMK